MATVTRKRRRTLPGAPPVALASIGERKSNAWYAATEPTRDPQEHEYELVMGRPWSDDPPAPIDFGAPAAPDGTDVATVVAFHAAYDEWKTTEACERWQAAYDRWSARRVQFRYSPRKKNASSVIDNAKGATA